MANGNIHRVEISCQGKVIGDWSGYEFGCSMVTPSDVWSMDGPYSTDRRRALPLDGEVILTIDGTPQLNGFIDDFDVDSRGGSMKVHGRDRMGRLVQESIPTVSGYDGLFLTDAVKKLASPWFTNIVLSDARNRTVRRGKGGKAPAGGEPAIFNVKGKLDEDHAGRVEPGEMRWNMIEQLCSSVSLLCWPSCDGRELIIGKPNYTQEVQYLFQRTSDGVNTCSNIQASWSVRDRYAMIEAHGSAPGNDEDYGQVTISKLGTAFDAPTPDGTGRDFIHPKRLVLAQRALADNAEGVRAAAREMNRRNFNRHTVTVQAPNHGQLYRSTTPTLFAPNTLARVVDDFLGIDGIYIVYACTFRARRDMAETTELRMVPRNTVFIS